MPITNIIILLGFVFIVFAFLALTVVLAPKEIARSRRKHAMFGSDAHVVAPKRSVEAEAQEENSA